MGLTPPTWILCRKRENSFLSRNHSIGNHKILQRHHLAIRSALPVLQRGETIQFHVLVTPLLRESVTRVTVLPTDSQRHQAGSSKYRLVQHGVHHVIAEGVTVFLVLHLLHERIHLVLFRVSHFHLRREQPTGSAGQAVEIHGCHVLLVHRYPGHVHLH